MTLTIRFGLALDGERGGAPRDALNDVDVGPLGLIGILETRLGLVSGETPQAQRVLLYRDCLRRCDSGTRFYHDSLIADELGTAATLLDWRDQWHLQGWDKSLAFADAPRLHDMQAVETEAGKCLPPSVGERLARILVVLDRRPARIDRLVYLDPWQAYPARWQALLAKLGATAAIDLVSSASTGLLAELQASLDTLARGLPPAKLKWRDDGSIRVVRGETRLLAGRWVAAQLPGHAGSTLLVAEDGAFLDEVLSAAGASRQGFRHASPFRPALQLVPLALAQLWKPVDVQGLIEFLTHPICPVPGYVRYTLAERIAQSPGIGPGKAWADTLDHLSNACQKSGRDLDAALASIRDWVAHPRHDPTEGAPIAAVLARMSALAEFFRKGMGDSDPMRGHAFRTGFSQARQCQVLVETLAEQGETRLLPQALRTLVAQATARGGVNPGHIPEVGACRAVTDPAAMIDPVDRVIWWQLTAPQMPVSWPWSPAEQAALKTAGVTLPDLDTALAHQARTWERAVRGARQQLLLVLPPPGEELHPLWLMLDALFEAGHKPVITALEQALAGQDEGLETLAVTPLPQRRRSWFLPAQVTIPKRDRESFSSLESFVFNPSLWLLKYPARLRRGSLVRIGSDHLLYGNLAHHLIEGCYRQPGVLSWSEAEVRAWYAPAFADLVAAEGAPLVQPGRRQNLEDLRHLLGRALVELHRHLLEAGAVRVEPERTLDGQFSGGRLGGAADLVVSLGDGRTAIVDMKWASIKRFTEKLALNRHLQLTLYGEMLRQKTGAWPQLAYFILCDARLLASNASFFPSARVVAPGKSVIDQGAPDLWLRFLKTWSWRRAQLDAGRVDVVLEADPESALEAPEDGLALEVLPPQYNDYQTLAGWGEYR